MARFVGNGAIVTFLLADRGGLLLGLLAGMI